MNTGNRTYDIDHSFTTADEFINFFLDSNIFEQRSLFDVSDKLTIGYFFRGQAKKEWTLLSTAHRSPEAL